MALKRKQRDVASKSFYRSLSLFRGNEKFIKQTAERFPLSAVFV